MTENKDRKNFSGVLKISDKLDRAISIEAARLNIFKYEVVERAWAAYLSSSGLPSEDQSTQTGPIDLGDIPLKHRTLVAEFLRVLTDPEEDASGRGFKNLLVKVLKERIQERAQTAEKQAKK